MIRAFPDAGQGLQKGHGALIDLGSRTGLTRELEERLLAAGALVVRTRVTDRALLLPLAHGGAVILAVGEPDSGEVRVTVFDHGAVEVRGTFDQEAADSILAELRRADVIPGEENG